jgi:uncharacterized membrane protein YccC
MVIAVLRNLPTRNAVARKPARLASELAAMARALDRLHESELTSEPANPSRQPHLPTFIVYDVLDVIGGGRGVNWR